MQPISDVSRQVSEREFWNGYAPRYDRFISRLQPTYDLILHAASRYVSAHTDVLEVATGTGRIALAIASRCRSVEACDIAPQMVREAERKQVELGARNVRFSVQDAYALSYPEESFDLVIASNVLHVMMQPERALESIAGVLKNGGLLLAPHLLPR